MAIVLEPIDVGVEGNDGTGDSIRNAFIKVNDNFGIISDITGVGTLAFTDLSDVSDISYTSGAIVVGNATGLSSRIITSTDGSISIDATDPATLNIELVQGTLLTHVSDDINPALGGPLDCRMTVIGNLIDPPDTIDLRDPIIIADFNENHNPSAFDIYSMPVSINYGINNYLTATPTFISGTKIPGSYEIDSDLSITGQLNLGINAGNETARLVINTISGEAGIYANKSFLNENNVDGYSFLGNDLNISDTGIKVCSKSTDLMDSPLKVVANGFDVMVINGSGDIVNAGALSVGKSVGSGDAIIEIGKSRSADGGAYLDLHSVYRTPETGAEFRIFRTGGVNGLAYVSQSGTGDIQFRVNTVAEQIGGTFTEAMTIKSSGRIGIGVASPVDNLQNNGTTGFGQSGTSGQYATHYYPDIAADATFWIKNSDNILRIGQGATAYSGLELLQLDTTGRIGIGRSISADYGIATDKSIWCGSTIVSGADAINAAIVSVEVGGGRQYTGPALVDLFSNVKPSNDPTNSDFRIIRESGTNAESYISHSGSGDFNIKVGSLSGQAGVISGTMNAIKIKADGKIGIGDGSTAGNAGENYHPELPFPNAKLDIRIKDGESGIYALKSFLGESNVVGYSFLGKDANTGDTGIKVCSKQSSLDDAPFKVLNNGADILTVKGNGVVIAGPSTDDYYIQTLSPVYSRTSVRAFVVFNGTFATPTPGNALNIASVTKIGVGVYSIAFSNALDTINYIVNGMAQDETAGSNSHCPNISLSDNTSAPKTVNGFRIDVVSATQSFMDSSNIMLTVYM